MKLDDGRTQTLKLEDLVAVHVTDTFPQDGVIRTRFSHEKESEQYPIVRDTVHFSLNHPVANPGAYGNFDKRAYAILIPLDKLRDAVRDRMQNFNPVDTFVLGDIELPEGSIVLGDADSFSQILSKEMMLSAQQCFGQSTGKAGKADLVAVDFDSPSQSMSGYDGQPINNGFRMAVYRQIFEMGYIPMAGGCHNWRDYFPEDYVHLEEAEGLSHNSHVNHWTYNLESIGKIVQNSIKDMEHMRLDEAIDGLKLAVKAGEQFLGNDKMPEKYKDILKLELGKIRLLYENILKDRLSQMHGNEDGKYTRQLMEWYYKHTEPIRDFVESLRMPAVPL